MEKRTEREVGLTSSRGSSARMVCRWHPALVGPSGATVGSMSVRNIVLRMSLPASTYRGERSREVATARESACHVNECLKSAYL